MRTPRTAAGLILTALAMSLAACGGSDSGKDKTGAGATSVSTETSTTGGSAPGSNLDAEGTLRSYFTALNAGDAKTICALEDDTLEMFKYDATGSPCLDEEANKTAQPALPSGRQITIAQRAETADTANFTVKDQKGASIQAQLVRQDGHWLMHVFT